jgi:hypothetical protein
MKNPEAREPFGYYRNNSVPDHFLQRMGFQQKKSLSLNRKSLD